MGKKLFFIVGSVVFLAVSAFIVSLIVRDEKNKTAKTQQENPENEEISRNQTENFTDVLNAPVKNIENKSDAKKALSDADSLASSIEKDDLAE
jgi:hypothetical protein